MQPTTHYAKSGDIHVAYQVFGEGSSECGSRSVFRVEHRELLGRTRFCPVAASSGKLRAGGDVRQARNRHVGQGHHH